MGRVTTICFLIVGLSGCLDTSKIAPPVVQLGAVENVELLEVGREVYINKCTKCHNAVRISRFSRWEWDTEILPDMIDEATLDSHEVTAITAYVHAVLKHQPELYSSADSSSR